MRPISSLPIPVKRHLRVLGLNIRNARLRRRITMEMMAERASISRATLSKIERGDPSVALGSYASVIFVLGLIANLGDLLSADRDTLGRILEEEHLPKRVRLPPKPKAERNT